MELFWRDGYAATGLDVLVRRTGASRYGLYATVGGKRDPFLPCVARHSQAVIAPALLPPPRSGRYPGAEWDPIGEPLDQERPSPRESRAFFDRVLELIRRPGDRRG